MKNYYLFILSVITYVFSSCQDFVKEEKITGGYYLLALDVKDDLTLSYRMEDGNHLGIIDKTVFAVGNDNNYIIVKQHPSNNKTITNYYIVPIYKKPTLTPEKGVIGPLTFEQFNEKKNELKILKSVTFTEK